MASDLITTDLVALDADFGDSVDSVITNLATLVHDTGRATDIAGWRSLGADPPPPRLRIRSGDRPSPSAAARA